MTCPHCNPPGSGNASAVPDDEPPEDCHHCKGSGQLPNEQEIVYELRIGITGDLPASLQVLDTSALMQMVISAAQRGDADDDAYIQITSVKVHRVH